MKTLEELYEAKKRIDDEINNIVKINQEEYKKKALEEHSKYIGKCFKTINTSETKEGVYAFKIVRLSGTNSADCITLVENEGYVSIERDISFGVWHYFSIGTYEDEKPLVIDNYQEITNQEFYKYMSDFLDRIEYGY